MRILYDHQVFSLQDAGGASRYHYELIRNLQAFDDVQIELLLGLNASVMPFADLNRAQTKVLGWNSRIRPGYGRYAVNEGLSSLMCPFRGKFDIYHPTLYRALPWVRGRRLVVTHHDCTHERFPQLFRNAASILRSKRKLFARAAAILCVSESSRQDLLHFYNVAEEKTHVVHHGFSPLRSGPGAEGRNEARNDPYLLYVGSRASYKNFALLLESLSLCGAVKHYRLVAAGGGPLSAEEGAKISKLGLSRRVAAIPRANDADLANLYRGASLFVYPSLYEGFGFPPLEAMSLGCPVLAHRTSSLPEICGDAAFYFESSDPQELAAVLASTLGNGPGLSEKRRLGFERVRLYDWAKTASRTLEVYAACSGA